MNFDKQKKDIVDIWRRIKTRDFSGYKGKAIKNNIFQTSTTLVTKAGSLIFTIIIARLLMPELFGLYSLALSTIILFSALSNPGITDALIRFISREIGKRNRRKAKAYAFYFGKIKFLLVFISIFLLIFSARFISETYYEKPLFLALIAGILYIIFLRISSFMQTITQSSNYFEGDLYKEIVLQTSRLVLVPFAVLMTLKYGFSSEKILFFMIIALSIAQFLASLFISTLVKKKLFLFKTKTSEMSLKEKKKARNFLVAISATALAGLFFGNIDMLILGHFVNSEFIGYYKAGFALISSLVPLVTFAKPLMPIFSRMNKTKLKSILNRSISLMLIISILLVLIILIFAPYIILIIYGEAYSNSTNILRVFALLLFATPVITLYQAYFISIGKPKILAKLLIISTVINIILNYLLISYLLNFGEMQAIFGAVIATLISKYSLLLGLIISKKHEEKNLNEIK